MVSFDGDPTAGNELFRKLDKATRDEHESKVKSMFFMHCAIKSTIFVWNLRGRI